MGQVQLRQGTAPFPGHFTHSVFIQVSASLSQCAALLGALLPAFFPCSMPPLILHPPVVALLQERLQQWIASFSGLYRVM